ncbi:MAG: hypothetical protein HY868_07515 [Chloroflexi bacterium]|nr:hypothetical protein [Chloroflexota bacterium]
MAVTITDLKQMQRDIETLKKKVAQLERRGNGKRHPLEKRQPGALRSRAADENTLVDKVLQRAGLLAELTPEEKAMAAEWRALPEAEKQRIRDTLRNLKLEKPLSQIIIENR